MSALDALTAEFHAIVAKAEALGHTGLDELRAVWARVTGDAPKLEAEAVADATQVAHDASAAMGPVLAEAEKDAAKVEAKAVADVESAIQPPATTA